MLEIIKQDLYRLIGNKCHNLKYQIVYLLKSPGFKYVYIFRHRQAATNLFSKTFWELLLHTRNVKLGFRYLQSRLLAEDLGFFTLVPSF